MIPFIFSALAIAAVGRAAMAMVHEVRRQFKEIPGIMEYKAEPEYEKCVEISNTGLNQTNDPSRCHCADYTIDYWFRLPRYV
jgi:Na+/H+-translocating membrane pyrophosphatase